MNRLSTESPLKSGRYLKSEDFFFESSKLFAAQITDLLDFVWPTAAAMWNLRWQVKGFLQERTQPVTVQELHAKFGSDTQIIKPNYYRACVDSTWDEQQEQFASFLLINAFAFYESWIIELLSSLQIGDDKLKRRLEKSLQYPSQGPQDGIFEALAHITTSKSLALTEAFFPIFSSKKKYCYQELNQLMKCYRYFKEVRNSIVHRGGLVNQVLEMVSIEYELLQDKDLKAKEKPAFYPLRLGERSKLKIRGVVGFLDILLKIVTTLDAQILCSEYAEIEFERRWRMDVNKLAQSLKKSFPDRHRKIGSMAREGAFPRPASTKELEQWLLKKSLIN